MVAPGLVTFTAGYHLSGYNLSGYNLSGYNLSGYNLSGYNLFGYPRLLRYRGVRSTQEVAGGG
ncbi:hypothetical protein Pan216_29340 [Planctomycetes bacterium Pan216]|uniref:Pentapeptide repeats (8 copies) n=1 Tax=Kolteria novifilia TaxID=2527975 RepID=A0A518B511_9BACT|nr:hypothetical protein Pan216_29340 [Planctomycetes bacterium Pan216]